ncbi:MAG TPA: DinB family protein [Ohtaekwangia sp.]
MKPFLLTLIFACALLIPGKAQSTTTQAPAAPAWTEADRKFLLDNLIRSRDEIINETKNLTKEQWNFKESPDRWSINQIVEHIAIWELLFMHEVSRALTREPDPSFAYAVPDSIFFDDPKGVKKNNALEYTKPFSFAVPLGNNEGKNNVAWLTTMRNESIDYLKKETKNIQLQYDYCAGPSVHQYYIMIFSHTDRHLRQIRKVKVHSNYPK